MLLRYSTLIHLLFVCLPFAQADESREHDTVELVPYVNDWETADQSLVDLSHFLNAPAGKDGFVTRRGEHLIHPDGSRFRIWGVNITGGLTFPDQTTADLVAADLARAGFNTVRFHHLDPDWYEGGIFGRGETTRRLDPAMLDKFDYFVAALKKRGIYTNINLNVMRRYRKNDGVIDADKLGLGKGATFFDPKLIALQREFARQLMTHVNPYTGNSYAKEPAVITVEFVNENSLCEAWMSNRLLGRDVDWADTWAPIPPSYDAMLTKQFNTFLNANYADDLPAFRESVGVAKGKPIPRSNGGNIWKRPRELFRAEARFIIQKERIFFEEMRTLLKTELGVEALLVGSADHNDSLPGYPHIRNNMVLDIVDGHGYWKHPSIGKVTRSANTPMVNDPFDSTIVQFARTPAVGYPFTISETNHPFPDEHAVEGYALLTAYALFHDWDGIYWFSYKAGRQSDPQSDGIYTNGWFAVDPDPVKMAALQTCAAMWHRHDVSPAKTRIVRRMSDVEMIDSMRSDWNRLRPFFEPGFALSTPLQHATRVEFSDEADPNYPPASSLDSIMSDTNELHWKHADAKTGVVTVDTERSQALIGFVSSHDESTANLSAAITNRFAAVQLTSMDGEPIKMSRRLLLLHGARATNTDFAWEDDRKTVRSWGKGPTVIEPCIGRITLSGLEEASRMTIQPLAANGTPLGAASSTTIDKGQATIAVGAPAAVWSLLTVE